PSSPYSFASGIAPIPTESRIIKNTRLKLSNVAHLLFNLKFMLVDDIFHTYLSIVFLSHEYIFVSLKCPHDQAFLEPLLNRHHFLTDGSQRSGAMYAELFFCLILLRWQFHAIFSRNLDETKDGHDD